MDAFIQFIIFYLALYTVHVFSIYLKKIENQAKEERRLADTKSADDPGELVSEHSTNTPHPLAVQNGNGKIAELLGDSCFCQNFNLPNEILLPTQEPVTYLHVATAGYGPLPRCEYLH